MADFKVGYFIRMFLDEIHQSTARQGAGRARPAGTPADRDPVRGTAALQLRLRRCISAGSDVLQGGRLFGRRRTVRHSRIQPLDSRSAQERYRLGESSLRQESFARKPSAVIGTSPGKIGTAVAQQHLRSILGLLQFPADESIEAYIQFERGLITDDDLVTNKGTEDFLRNYMGEFGGFIERVFTVLPRTTSVRRHRVGPCAPGTEVDMTGMNGKVAIVTGGGSGLGEAIAKALARKGQGRCLRHQPGGRRAGRAGDQWRWRHRQRRAAGHGTAEDSERVVATRCAPTARCTTR